MDSTDLVGSACFASITGPHPSLPSTQRPVASSKERVERFANSPDWVDKVEHATSAAAFGVSEDRVSTPEWIGDPNAHNNANMLAASSLDGRMRRVGL